jgi:hypothetical protein
MADKIANESHFSGGPQGRSTTATASGINALNPIALFQVSMLRMWAHSIERFATNYEKALNETSRGTVR